MDIIVRLLAAIAGALTFSGNSNNDKSDELKEALNNNKVLTEKLEVENRIKIYLIIFFCGSFILNVILYLHSCH